MTSGSRQQAQVCSPTFTPRCRRYSRRNLPGVRTDVENRQLIGQQWVFATAGSGNTIDGVEAGIEPVTRVFCAIRQDFWFIRARVFISFRKEQNDKR